MILAEANYIYVVFNYQWKHAKEKNIIMDQEKNVIVDHAYVQVRNGMTICKRSRLSKCGSRLYFMIFYRG